MGSSNAAQDRELGTQGRRELQGAKAVKAVQVLQAILQQSAMASACVLVSDDTMSNMAIIRLFRLQ